MANNFTSRAIAFFEWNKKCQCQIHLWPIIGISGNYRTNSIRSFVFVKTACTQSKKEVKEQEKIGNRISNYEGSAWWSTLKVPQLKMRVATHFYGEMEQIFISVLLLGSLRRAIVHFFAASTEKLVLIADNKFHFLLCRSVYCHETSSFQSNWLTRAPILSHQWRGPFQAGICQKPLILSRFIHWNDDEKTHFVIAATSKKGKHIPRLNLCHQNETMTKNKRS